MGKRIKITISITFFFLFSCTGIQTDTRTISKKDKDAYCWMLYQNKESCFNNENTDFFLRLTIVGGLGLPTYIFTLKKQKQSILLKEKKQIETDSFLTESLVFSEKDFLKKNEECTTYLDQKVFFEKDFISTNNNSIVIDDGLHWFLEVKNKAKYKFITRSFSSEKDKDIIIKIANVYDIKYKNIAIEKLFTQ